MMKKILLAAVLSIMSSSAWAACSQIPLTIKDASSNTVSMSSATAADGSCLTNIGVAAGGMLAGAGVDGWDLTQGAKADTAWVSGSGSVIAILKAISGNTGAAIPAGTSLIGSVAIGGGVAASSQDPCTGGLKTNVAINQNGTSSVQLVALSASTKIYVCSLSIVAAGATTVAFTTGTGSACVTGNAAVIGTTTASIANSISLAANGGMTLGSGSGTIASGAASSELCMILGTNVFVSGNLTYVQQ